MLKWSDNGLLYSMAQACLYQATAVMFVYVVHFSVRRENNQQGRNLHQNHHNLELGKTHFYQNYKIEFNGKTALDSLFAWFYIPF